MCFFPITLGDSLQNTCIIKSNCTITLHGHFQYNFRMVIPMSKFVVWWQKDKDNDMQYNTREREREERDGQEGFMQSNLKSLSVSPLSFLWRPRYNIFITYIVDLHCDTTMLLPLPNYFLIQPIDMLLIFINDWRIQIHKYKINYYNWNKWWVTKNDYTCISDSQKNGCILFKIF